ncbi:uncharacterized protein [Haliotis cracherodii]|uniref:uncharacterized protein n=1 Tax=Haliotis cracherodii TaxID=6455 RepID=UPI0039EC06BE
MSVGLYQQQTAAFSFSRNRNLEEVRWILSRVSTSTVVGWWSRTPVMWAAHGGNREVVELLVSEGADVSLMDMYGYNLFHLACLGGNVETVTFVRSLNGVDIDARNK